MMHVAGRTWTAAQAQHVRDVFHAGEMTLKEIAVSCGIDPGALHRRYVRKALGLPVGPTRDKGGSHLGRLKVPQRAHPLVRRLYEIINRERTTMKGVSEQAGLNRKSVYAWRNQNPYLHNFEAALNVLGKKLAIVDIEPEDRRADQENHPRFRCKQSEVKRVLPQRHYVTDFSLPSLSDKQ